MSNNDHKPRLPDESGTNAGVPTVNRQGSFPVVEMGPDGSVTHKTRDNSNNNDNDHSTIVTSDGGFKSKNFDSDPKRNSLDLELNTGSVRKYSMNSSITTNANADRNTGGNSKRTVKLQCGFEAGKDVFEAVGGNKLTVANGNNVDVTRKSSQNNKQKVTSGNDNEKVTGSKNFSVEGDSFHSTGESRYDIVKNGEYGIHLPSGNMDVQLDSGKARISASQEILLICGSSYVKILPTRIEIVANRIDLNP
jgi:hypothetical protein